MGDRVTYTGVVTGTGSALNVTKLGFRPRSVKLYNIDGLCTLYWQNNMPDAYGFKEITDGTKSYISANGITPLVNGFTIGADADINVSGERIKFEAVD